MSNKNKKYKGGTTHRLAVLQAIGQLEIVNDGCVKVSDIMPFMRVSKPTALKALKAMAFERNEIIMIKNEDVGNFGVWEFQLHDDMREEFREGIYKPYFQAYVNEMFLVAPVYPHIDRVGVK